MRPSQMIDHSRPAHEADLMRHAEKRRVDNHRGGKIIKIVWIGRNNEDAGVVKMRVNMRMTVTAMRVAENNVAAGSRTALRDRSRDPQTGVAWSLSAGSGFPRQTQDQSHGHGGSSRPYHLNPPQKRNSNSTHPSSSLDVCRAGFIT
jgi:hypothetical protein